MVKRTSGKKTATNGKVVDEKAALKTNGKSNGTTTATTNGSATKKATPVTNGAVSSNGNNKITADL